MTDPATRSEPIASAPLAARVADTDDLVARHRGAAYGELAVVRLIRELQQAGATRMRAPGCLAPDPADAALGMIALEAARRLGGAFELELDPSAEGERTRVRADAIDDALPRLTRGLHLRPQPHDPGAVIRVSVIVRSMDRPTLERTLDSIAMQTLREVEVVVVDARGGDHRPLPGRCGAMPLRMVQAGRPLARAAAANEGLRAASGEALLLLDDDDLLLPDHLHKLHEALQAAPDAVAAYADVAMGSFDADGRWATRHVFAAEFDAVRLRFENYLPLHGVLFDRRRAGIPLGRCFDESFAVYEDWDFWLQLAESGPFVHAPGISARYVLGPEGTSGAFVDSAGTRDARAALFAKWRLRLRDADHAALLVRAQALYRSAHETAAQLADLRLHAAAIEAVIAARDADIENGKAYQASLLSTLSARDVEITNQRIALEAASATLANLEAEAHALRTRVAALEAEGLSGLLIRKIRKIRNRLHGRDPH